VRQPAAVAIRRGGTDAPSRAAVEEALDAGNAWAKRAPVLIAAGARREDAAIVESRDYFLLDTGMALMSLLYRAVDQGLLVHPMAGWKEGALRAALGLPEDFTPAAVVAVGYAGKSGDLDEATRKKDEKPRGGGPSVRSPFRSRWGSRSGQSCLPSREGVRDRTAASVRRHRRDGHVNNAKIVTYLELGRMRFFADVLGAERVEDIRYIVAEVSCRYRIPILLHDRVFVRMHITDVSRSSFRFRCDLYDPRDGRVFVEAESVQVMYDYGTGRPVPMDAAFLGRARDYIGG